MPPIGRKRTRRKGEGEGVVFVRRGKRGKKVPPIGREIRRKEFGRGGEGGIVR